MDWDKAINITLNKGKLHFSPFNYWVISIPPFIYKTERCLSLCIENMQIAPTV